MKTEKQALKILEICNKKGFSNAEQEICKVQAKKSLDDQRYGNALEWAIRSKDTLYVTSVADFLLKVKLLNDNLKNLYLNLFKFFLTALCQNWRYVVPRCYSQHRSQNVYFS